MEQKKFPFMQCSFFVEADKMEMKNKIKKMVAGMMLVCSLLTLFGGVSSEGIVPYGETVIDGVQWIA